MRDLLVIGGSAAAAAAAVYAARRKLDLELVAKDFGGEVATSGEIENWPSVVHTDGITLANQFKAHVESYKVPMDLGVDVTQLEKIPGGFRATGAYGAEPRAYEAKALIIATGVHPRLLGAPGEKEFRGKGITYCTVCDGPLFGGKTVATIGGGNSALESAIMMAGIAAKVFLVNKNPAMKGDALLIDKVNGLKNIVQIMNARTKQFFGDTFLKSMSYIDAAHGQEKTLEIQGAFVHIGMVPNSGFVPAEVVKNPVNEIKVNALCETSVPGIFAAGDVTDVPYKQIGIAVGQGICAALTAVSYLNRVK